MSKDRKNKVKCQVFISAAIIGAVLFVYTYGGRILDFTYVDWLLPQKNDIVGRDIVQHYMGWVAFRKSEWHFPIGLIENIVYPNMISVVYTDSIPLFAFIFKLFSSVLPSEFQYMGLFGIICCMLQGGIASLLIYEYINNKLGAIIGSLFFSSSLLILHRLYLHTALAAHWIVLLSIYLWRCEEGRLSISKSCFYWSLLSMVSVLIQSYFLPMVCGCMLCSMLEVVIRTKTWKRCMLVIIVTASMTLIIGIIIGVFYGAVPASGSGLRIYSFNLNGFLNPMEDIWSKLFKVLPKAQNNYEGRAYLGAGVLCLLLFNLGVFVKTLCEKKRIHFQADKTIPLLCFYLGFLIVSLGPTISFGNYIINLDISPQIEEMWSVFRCTGRLIWPVYYMLMLFSCVYMFQIYKRNKSFCVFWLSVALCIQLYDQSGIRYETKRSFQQLGQSVSELKDNAWNEIAANYKHIMVCPDTESIYSSKKGLEVQIFANANNMTMNVIYLARNITQIVNKDVNYYFENVKQGKLPNDWNETCYVFFDKWPGVSVGLYYYVLDDIIIGLPRELQSIANVPGYDSYGFTIDLINEDPLKGNVLRSGWSGKETTGFWTEGVESNILLYMKNTIDLDKKLVFELDDYMPGVSVELAINDQIIGVQAVTNKRLEFSISKENLKAGNMKIQLGIRNPMRPKDIFTGSDDTRMLGILVKRIKLE